MGNMTNEDIEEFKGRLKAKLYRDKVKDMLILKFPWSWREKMNELDIEFAKTIRAETDDFKADFISEGE